MSSSSGVGASLRGKRSRRRGRRALKVVLVVAIATCSWLLLSAPPTGCSDAKGVVYIVVGTLFDDEPFVGIKGVHMRQNQGLYKIILSGGHEVELRVAAPAPATISMLRSPAEASVATLYRRGEDSMLFLVDPDGKVKLQTTKPKLAGFDNRNGTAWFFKEGYLHSAPVVDGMVQEGSASRISTTGQLAQLTLSRNGQYVAVYDEILKEASVIDVRSGSAKARFECERHVWASRRDALAYVKGNSLYCYDLQANRHSKLGELPDPSVFLAWSPDEKHAILMTYTGFDFRRMLPEVSKIGIWKIGTRTDLCRLLFEAWQVGDCVWRE